MNEDQSCVQEVNAFYKERRNALINGLNRAGWEIEMPQATMFAWGKIPPMFAHLDSVEFSKMLIREAKVAVAPGRGFGEYGDEYVRFALVENIHRINQAIRGIRKVLQDTDDPLSQENAA